MDLLARLLCGQVWCPLLTSPGDRGYGFWEVERRERDSGISLTSVRDFVGTVRCQGEMGLEPFDFFFCVVDHIPLRHLAGQKSNNFLDFLLTRSENAPSQPPPPPTGCRGRWV